MTGKRVGAYRLETLLGEGSTGVVYRAVDERNGRVAAIKVLSPALARDEQHVQRFFDEARITRIVPHHSLVEVFDAGTLADGTPYLAMEYLTGESLRARMIHQGGKLPLGEALWIARQIAAALAAVHAKGILHRDLKPENVIISNSAQRSGAPFIDDSSGQAPSDPGRLKLLDFGMAKFLDAATRRTAAGTVMGTPTYMSPEQCLARGALDDRTDVYSLGVMLFEMLAGAPPFGSPGQGPLAVIMQHVQGVPPLLRDRLPCAPAEVEVLIGDMLSRPPKQRPAMAQVVARIRALEAGESEDAVSPSAATPRAPGPPPPDPQLMKTLPAMRFIDDSTREVGRLPTLMAPALRPTDPGPESDDTTRRDAYLPTLASPALTRVSRQKPPRSIPKVALFFFVTGLLLSGLLFAALLLR